MLNYKLIGNNDFDNPKRCVLQNRGIENVNEYLHLTSDCLIDYHNLDNISEAVQMFSRHIENKSKIAIVVDCDADGYTSASMMYLYIKQIAPEIHIECLMHEGKQHGLSPDITIPEETNFVILPDGGTNDTEQCKMLYEKGIDVLILDHHLQDKENPYAVIVNNQISENYSNKELCGAGVVYKFLQAVDDETWNEYADDFLDLVALGNISDLMDIRSYETKYLIEKGLKQIHNKCFQGFITAQDYSIKGCLNINAVAFYITPLINAMCRCGSMEDKRLVFNAFLETDETFKYKKRGEKEEIDESIYDRASRLCKNAKSRQDKIVQKALPELKEKIDNRHTNDNSVMFVKVSPNITNTFTGLIAMKLADCYSRPCLVLRQINEGLYGGSARGYDNCPIDSIKETLLNTNNFEFCQGHNNAFGCQIKADNISKTIQMLNQTLKDIDFDTIKVDFEMDFYDMDISFIQSIDELKDYYGTGIKSPKIVLHNIELMANQGVILKDEITWKFITDDNIVYIKFKNDKNDIVLNFLKDNNKDKIIVDAICQVEVSVFNGIASPQVKILDYEVI